MGAVHGVYLKYVGLSAVSYAAYTYVVSQSTSGDPVDVRNLAFGGASQQALFHRIAIPVLFYSALLNGVIAILFRLERGMKLIGKDKQTGKIPLWSYALYFPFHLPTMLYTYVHTKFGSHKVTTPDGHTKKEIVPVASEVQRGWWVGGCYAYELGKEWGGIVDLTVEFPEKCIDASKGYLLLPTWDGVPATPAQLEEAAIFAVDARKKGDVLVHCAHGRGRSTTVMCVCLVKAGMYTTWEEAFEKGIKPGRNVCKLNSKMRKALTQWQAEYVDGKKGS
jgi:protein-tyrosine phosphatase|mmetsp:Transcript_24358/g.44055  ORF Transcript_24358/g.44055 Transcript_24358/m.44055 type:complete len:278 (-) Transcript_24358:278-1111(-)